jgi:hypothetical protein
VLASAGTMATCRNATHDMGRPLSGQASEGRWPCVQEISAAWELCNEELPAAACNTLASPTPQPGLSSTGTASIDYSVAGRMSSASTEPLLDGRVSISAGHLHWAIGPVPTA